MESHTFIVAKGVKEEEYKNRTPVNIELLGLSPEDLNNIRAKKMEAPSRTLIQTSITADSILVETNSFISSAIRAYSQHHHLSIRPDDIWLAIITQFSFYLNANSEQLRNKIVDFQGKKELKVFGHGTLFNADYVTMSTQMSKEIAANITDPSIREWVIPSFTTTTASDQMVGAVALMATMKNYFTYKYCLMCGLPKVTLHGSVDDWKAIKTRAARLTEFELPANKRMAEWLKMLNPVLDQFIATASHKPDVKWWNRIANYVGGGSGPSYISGWITVFAVFTEKGEWVGDKKEVKLMSGTEKSEWPLVDSQDVPAGFVSAPVTVEDNGKQFKTELIAGHIAIKLPNATTIVPQLDWCLLLLPSADQ
eukprot:gene7319-8522_t